MMSPAPASVIGAGIGICTFCTEWMIINFELLQSNLIEKLSSFNCQRHPRPLHCHCGQYQFHSVQSDTWLQLLRQLEPADSCAILKPAVRTSARPPATTLLLVNIGDRKLFWQPGVRLVRAEWCSDVRPRGPHTWCSLCWVTGVCEMCPPPPGLTQCQLSSAAAAGATGQCSWLVLRVLSRAEEGGHWSPVSPLPLSRSCPPSPAGLEPWLTVILWEWNCVGYKKDTALSLPVPRIIIGPGDSPLAGPEHDWEPQDSSWRNRLTAARAWTDRYHDISLLRELDTNRQTHRDGREVKKFCEN